MFHAPPFHRRAPRAPADTEARFQSSWPRGWLLSSSAASLPPLDRGGCAKSWRRAEQCFHWKSEMYRFRNTYNTHKPVSSYCRLICHVDKLTHLNVYNRQRRGLVEEELEQLQIRLLGSHVKTSSPTFQVLGGWVEEDTAGEWQASYHSDFTFKRRTKEPKHVRTFAPEEAPINSRVFTHWTNICLLCPSSAAM